MGRTALGASREGLLGVLYGFLHKLSVWECQTRLEELAPHNRKSVGSSIQNPLKNPKALRHTNNQIPCYCIQMILLLGSLCDLQPSIDEVP